MAAAPPSSSYFDDRASASGQAMQFRSRAVGCRYQFTAGETRGDDFALPRFRDSSIAVHTLEDPTPSTNAELVLDLSLGDSSLQGLASLDDAVLSDRGFRHDSLR